MVRRANCARRAGRKALASIVIVPVKDQRDYGLVVLDEHDQILKFQEKSDLTPQDKGDFWINAGIYLFTPDIFKKFSQKNSFSLEYHVFRELEGKKLLYGKKFKDSFIDIGTPERFKQAQTFIK